MADQKNSSDAEKKAKNEKDTGPGLRGGNMGAGRSGKEGMGSEKPSDGQGMGSQKPGGSSRS